MKTQGWKLLFTLLLLGALSGCATYSFGPAVPGEAADPVTAVPPIAELD